MSPVAHVLSACRVSIASLFLSLFIALPCGLLDAEAPSEETAKAPAEDAASPAPAPGEETPAEEAAPSKLPAGILARVNGHDIVVKEYADYLLASVGTSRLGEYIDRLLIAAEAQEQGIVVPAEEVETLVESHLERTIEGIYQGDKERFLAGLTQQGTTLQERQDWLRQKLYYDTLLTKIILKQRVVSDDAVRKEFEVVYGPKGVTYEIRHILVSTERRTGPKGEVLAPRPVDEARRRAAQILEEIKKGADFSEQVKKYCDDTFTRRSGGLVPDYRPGLFGPEFDKAVESLSEEHPLSGVVRSRRGFHIIQLLNRRVTTFDAVRESLIEDLRRRLPGAKERLDALVRLRAKAEIVR